MGQEQNISDDSKKHGTDGTGSPHNLNDWKRRGTVKSFGDRKDVNALISGKGIGQKRAGPNK